MKHFDVYLRGAAEVVADKAIRFFYTTYLLSDRRKGELRARARLLLGKQSHPGVEVTLRLPQTRVSVQGDQ
jgi:hypothetical protein